MLLEQNYGITKSDLIVYPERLIELNSATVEDIVRRIEASEPLQYITGRCYFMQEEFEVDSGVLIPRCETEQLVGLIVKECRGGEKILDIGTGSGVIAIMLAKLVPNSQVIAYDISLRALSIAKRNSQNIAGGRVKFCKVDILQLQQLDEQFDIIVSNPPYVCLSEIAKMSANVLKYEPHLALFVDDDNPLLFYRKIAQLACKGLKNRGMLYFEINEAFGKDMIEMMGELGFYEIELVNDIFDKPRMVKARKV